MYRHDLFQRLDEESRYIGLAVNRGKTKVMIKRGIRMTKEAMIRLNNIWKKRGVDM